MPQRTLRFRIRQDGRVEESVEGALGASCHQLTESLEKDLGVVQQRETTAEGFIQPNQQSQTIPAKIH